MQTQCLPLLGTPECAQTKYVMVVFTCLAMPNLIYHLKLCVSQLHYSQVEQLVICENLATRFNLQLYLMPCNLKVLNQLDFFATLISNKFCKKPNLPTLQHASSFVQLFLCSFCEIIHQTNY